MHTSLFSTYLIKLLLLSFSVRSRNTEKKTTEQNRKPTPKWNFQRKNQVAEPQMFSTRLNSHLMSKMEHTTFELSLEFWRLIFGWNTGENQPLFNFHLITVLSLKKQNKQNEKFIKTKKNLI